jgi:hypothetical protein
VNSIVGSTAGVPRQSSSATRKVWREVLAKLDKLSNANPADTELAQIRRLTRDLQHLGDGVVNLPMARAMNKQIDATLEKRDFDDLHLVLTEMTRLRNAAVHGTIPNSPDTVRSVYSLEGDSDGE